MKRCERRSILLSTAGGAERSGGESPERPQYRNLLFSNSWWYRARPQSFCATKRKPGARLWGRRRCARHPLLIFLFLLFFFLCPCCCYCPLWGSTPVKVFLVPSHYTAASREKDSESAGWKMKCHGGCGCFVPPPVTTGGSCVTSSCFKPMREMAGCHRFAQGTLHFHHLFLKSLFYILFAGWVAWDR